MKARKHRGGFAESIATMKELPASLEAVAAYFETPSKSIKITPYSYDNRKEWDAPTWLVSNGNGVIGMISSEVSI